MIIIIICHDVLSGLAGSDLRLACNNVTFLASEMLGIIIEMSIIERKSILIIKAPAHNLRPVEHYLEKRSFKVFVEHDIKMAMLKLAEVQPSIIFLAWDHPNLKIMDLPQQMAQVTKATIIPYTMGFTKDDVRKLDACAMNPKLYPPISGPAIERLVAKFVKIEIRKNSDYDEIVNGYKTEKVPETPTVVTRVSPVAVEPALAPPVKPARQTNVIVIKQQKRQEILLSYKKKTLSTGVTAELKKTFPVQVKIPIERLLLTATKTAEPKSYRAYCLAVVCETWCGYLTVISDHPLEMGPLRKIFTNWIKENFENVIEHDEHDFVEINNFEPELLELFEKGAEYHEKLDTPNFDLRVCFFSVEPAKMNIEMSDDHSLIKMSTDDIPANKELPFSLHLHLPENKKYIVYTQANKILSTEQKNRLIANKILMLYTPVSFEKEFKKFLTEKNLREFRQNPLQKKSAV